MTLTMLDAFSGAGGSGRGWQEAGFHVTGVDIADQPNYAGDDFYQGDAVAFIAEHGHKFDIIAGSPPCQADCTLVAGTNQGRGDHVSLLAPTRDAMLATGRPWIIEQPIGKAVMRRDLLLCGLMFPELAVLRHRQFELHGLTVPQPAHPSHKGHRVAGWNHGRWHEGDMFAVYGDGGGKGTVAQWQDAMGMHWTDVRKEIREAIPPAYTRLIGRAIRNQIIPVKVAA